MTSEIVLEISELQHVTTLRKWLEAEVEFYGRTDEEFLVKYLRGCKFNLDKTKKKIKLYYETRKRMPQWWANRNLNEQILQSLLKQMLTTVLIEKESDGQPTVVITKGANLGKNELNFDNCIRMYSIYAEIVARRPSCQLNGVIWIVDCHEYPFWFAKSLLSPVTVYKILQSIYFAMPFRLVSVNVLSSPFIAPAVWALVKPLISPKLRKRVHFHKSDLSQLHEHVPKELLPEEYGGLAGPNSQHDDDVERELSTFNEYLLEDNKYGFQEKY